MKVKLLSYLSYLLLGVGLLVSAGCLVPQSFVTATAGPEERQRMLAESAERFHRAILWGDFRQAAQFVDPMLRGEYQERLLPGGVRAANVRIEKQQLAPDDDLVGYVWIVVSWVEPKTLELRGKRSKQLWEFRRFDGGWQLRDVVASEDLRSMDASSLLR